MSAGGEELRELGQEDHEQAFALGRLAFGGDPQAPVPPPSPGRRNWGVFRDGRLLAKASVLSYAQWWGGRPVPMGGVAGVAVHPDTRGRGTGSRLVRALMTAMREDGQPVSALFPTGPAIYRPVGWEVVGTLDETRLPVTHLRTVPAPPELVVRSATEQDAPVLTELWDEAGRAGAGQLTRTGPCFPADEHPALEADVVSVAERDGAVTGYVSYDRGLGYGADAALLVWEMVARDGPTARALLHSLGTWESVVSTVRWRGSVDDLVLLLGRRVPPPNESQPWMLRITDAPAAVAARGFPPGVAAEASFELIDPDVPEHEGAWRLVVRDGAGALERCDLTPGLPTLHVRGLALLYAGGDAATLRRVGLLDGELPGIDLAFTGPAPRLLDYF